MPKAVNGSRVLRDATVGCIEFKVARIMFLQSVADVEKCVGGWR